MSPGGVLKLYFYGYLDASRPATALSVKRSAISN